MSYLTDDQERTIRERHDEVYIMNCLEELLVLRKLVYGNIDRFAHDEIWPLHIAGNIKPGTIGKR